MGKAQKPRMPRSSLVKGHGGGGFGPQGREKFFDSWFGVKQKMSISEKKVGP